MLNFKTILLLTTYAFGIVGCKPTAQSFSYKNNVDKEFFAHSMELAGLENMKTDSIKVFRAELSERLVERDAVPEYSLVNTKSDQEKVRLPDINNKHFLYLFQLFPESGSDTVFIYLSTSLNAKSTCIGLGPVYLGLQRRDRIQFNSMLKIVKFGMKYQPQEIKKRAAKGEVERRYHINELKGSVNIIFFNDQRFPPPDNRVTPIRLTQIIRDETNKIGGKKAEIFTTEKVFEDPKALVFSYYSTIYTK
jgi:hypothetical protein